MEDINQLGSETLAGVERVRESRGLSRDWLLIKRGRTAAAAAVTGSFSFRIFEEEEKRENIN